MNEELKIIISAVTDNAKKNIQGVKNELQGMSQEGGKSGKSMGKAFKAVGIAATAVIGTITAVTAALTALANNTKQFREEQARLNSAFQAAGGSAQSAEQAYNGLFRFMGDSDTASEAAAHLAQLTTDEKELAEWTTALQGVYSTFGKSLPIEGLTEAANETAKVGQVTGSLADALNWAGVSEDAFNASLQACNSEAEREQLIRSTLNGVYNDAAQLYEKNNAEIIAQNEAQARLDATTARIGKTVQPLVTALANLSNTLLTALAPAIEVVSNALTWLINAVSKAVQWIASFLGLLSGKGADTSGLANNVASVATGLGGAQKGATNVATGLADATKQAEKLKRATASFDELNVLSTDSASSDSGAAGGGSGAGAGGGISGLPSGGNVIDTKGFTEPLDNVSKKMESFVKSIKNALNKLKTVFAPTISGFKDFGKQISGAIVDSLPDFQAGLEGFKTGFGDIFSYLVEDIIPNITNSWAENILPMLGDTTAFGIEQLGKNFELLGTTFTNIVNDFILPALELFETMSLDAMTTVGDAWDKYGGDLLANLGEAFDGLRETWNTFYNECIQPILEVIIEWANEIWEESLKPLWDTIVDATMDITNNLTILWNKVLKPIVDWILQKIYPVVKQVVNNVLAVVKTVLTTVSDVIQGAIKVIKGIIAFITGVFTGDWKKAWNGIKDIVGGIWQAIWGVIKGFINLIIDGINALWSGIYHAVKGIVDTIGDVAGVVGDLLGQDWSFSMPDSPPLIPKLAKGGIVTSETLARIGEGGKKEAVLPLEQNTGWMDTLAEKLAAKTSAPSKIVLMINETELGWANINSINGITQQTGQLQLNII